jgi:hypothetical protein
VATGAEATEYIAKAAELLPAYVFRTARILREADKGLWPEAGKGGGKAAVHVRPRHLVNLAIAIAINDPLNAVKAIPAYRALLPHRSNQLDAVAPQDRGVVWSLLKANGLFNGRDSLGVELERLVGWLTKGDSARDLKSAGGYTEFFFDRLPRASFVYRTWDAEDDLEAPVVRLLYRRPNIPPDLSRDLNPYWNFPFPRLITRMAVIPVSVFSAMADLWADTKQHHIATTSPRASRAAALTEE